MAANTLKFNNPLNGWFWSLTGSVVLSKHDKMAKATQDGMLHATEMIDRKHKVLSWLVRTRLTKTLGFWKTFVGLTAQYMENHQKVLMSDEVVPYHTKTVTITGNYALQPNRYLSIEGSERFGYTTLSSPVMTHSHASSLVNKCDVNVFPSDIWKIKWSNAWYTNYRPKQSSIYFMNFSVVYTPKTFDLELQVNNVLDKQLYQQNTLTAMTEHIVCQSFRPREILLKATWYY